MVSDLMQQNYCLFPKPPYFLYRQYRLEYLVDSKYSVSASIFTNVKEDLRQSAVSFLRNLRGKLAGFVYVRCD